MTMSGPAPDAAGSAPRAVLLEHDGEWREADVLWSYVDHGRPRGLVRFETSTGLVLRQLRWLDELRPMGRLLELPLRRLERRDPGRRRRPPQGWDRRAPA